jgi:hypothetical protein
MTRLLVLLLAAAALAGCSRVPDAPSLPAPAASASPTSETSASASAPPSTHAAVPAPGSGVAASLLTLLSINGEADGHVFVGGRRVATSIPSGQFEHAPGRSAAQALFGGGAELSAPSRLLLREGGSVILYLRRRDRTERPVADFARVEHVAGGAWEAGDAPVEGSSEGSGAGAWPWPPVAAEVTAAGVSAGSGEATAEASGGATDVAALEVAGGSGVGADGAQDDAAATGAIAIISEPAGRLYLDGLPTPWRTPVELRLPARTWAFQVLHDGGMSLSREVDAPVIAGGRRQIELSGTEVLVIR